MLRLTESQPIGLSSLIKPLPFRLFADGPKIDHLSHSDSSTVTSEFQFYVQLLRTIAGKCAHRLAETCLYSELHKTELGSLRAKFNTQLVDYKTQANESE